MNELSKKPLDLHLLPIDPAAGIDAKRRAELHKVLGELLINVSDQYFKDKNVYVDGYRFINCSFENCKLRVYRGTFEFHHCVTKGGGEIFSDEAMKSVQLYTRHNRNLAVSPTFAPKVNPDGTFSIAKDI